MDKKKEKRRTRMYSIQIIVATALEKGELVEIVGAWADNQFIANQEPSVVAVNKLLAANAESTVIALHAAYEVLKSVRFLTDQVERLVTLTEKLVGGKITQEEGECT